MLQPIRKFFAAVEESNPAIPSPLVRAERITIIDSLRGIALLGILLMNIPFFGMAYQFNFNLNLRNEYSGVNYYTWWTINGIFEGTMRALFSLLFGAGTILLLSRLEKKSAGLSAADFYYCRLIWLLIFGVINAFIFLWPGDILYSYAICGLFLYPFRVLAARQLFIFGLLILSIATFKETLHWYNARDTRLSGERALALEKQQVKLTEAQTADKESWISYQDKHKTENLLKAARKETAEMQKGYFSIMVHLSDVNMKLQSSKFYSSNFWDILAFFFVGMAFFKWRILTGQRTSGFYWMLFLGGYLIGIALNFYALYAFINTRFDVTLIADKLLINYYQPRRLLVVFGHIGLVMLIYKYQIANWLLRIFAKVGQMAFSNYLMQSIFCVIIFYGFGFNLFGTLQRYELYYVVFAIWIFQIIFSNVWLQYFRFGPFEWVWRSLTYWQLQPMRIKEDAPNEIAFA